VMRCLVVCLLLSAALAATLVGTKNPIPGEYIIVLSPEETTVEAHLADVAHLLPESAIMHRYKIGSFVGYSARFDDYTLESLLNRTDIVHIETNARVEAIRHISRAATCSLQTGATWGIDRVGETNILLDGNFHHPSSGGASVTSYIVDTGVRIDHVEFEGRASFGFKAEASWSNTDVNGHGTHVAGTIGGKTYGLAKKCHIVAVKVLSDSGSGSWAGVIAGVDYVAADAPKRGRRATANMILGGGASPTLDSALTAAIASGVVFVVAAGNENQNACNVSPARTATAITAGSTAVANKSGKQVDNRSSFSNWGTCVSILAPGSLITSAWATSATATNTISGTSMASPHVCGVATLYLEAHPAATPAQVKAALIAGANSGHVDLACGASTVCLQTPNKLLHLSCV